MVTLVARSRCFVWRGLSCPRAPLSGVHFLMLSATRTGVSAPHKPGPHKLALTFRWRAGDRLLSTGLLCRRRCLRLHRLPWTLRPLDRRLVAVLDAVVLI